MVGPRYRVGTAWVVGQTIMERLAQIGIYFLVARLLGPTLFGLGSLSVAPALIAITVVQAYSQTISSNGVRGVSNTTDVFLACVLFGIVGAIGCTITGYFMSVALVSPALLPLTAFAALAPICTSLGTVAEGIIIQRQQYRAMALRRIIGILVAGTGAIFLAFNGFGAWAIAFQTVGTSLCSAIACFIAARWYPHKRPSLPGIGKAIYFSAPLMGSSGINMLTSRMSEMMLGYWLGPAASGLFRMAQSVIEIVSSVALAPVTSVFLPYLARSNNQAERAEALDFVSRGATIVMAIIALTGAVGSRGIFFVLPLAQWRTLDLMISISALGLPLSAYLSLFQTYFVAEKRPRLALYVNIFQNLTLVVLLVTFMTISPQAIGAACANVGRLTAAFFLVNHFRRQIYPVAGTPVGAGVLRRMFGMVVIVAMAKLGLPLATAGLTEWMQNSIDVIIGGLVMVVCGLIYRKEIGQSFGGRAVPAANPA